MKEFTRMLSPLGYSVISAKDAGFTEEVEETGATFAENAAIKARAICKACGKAAIGDDSGLCVDSLGGAPGVYSARYAGDGHDDEANIVKLLKNMRDVPEASARRILNAQLYAPSLTEARFARAEGATARFCTKSTEKAVSDMIPFSAWPAEKASANFRRRKKTESATAEKLCGSL